MSRRLTQRCINHVSRNVVRWFLANVHRDRQASEALSFLQTCGPAVILAGSAVSRTAPTGMPMAGEAIEGVIRGLVALLKQSGVKLDGRASEILAAIPAIKLELFFSVLSDYFGDDPRELAASIYGQREPNPNHRALASLAAKGHSLFTTNFDDNIEACLAPGVPAPIHLHGTAKEPASMAITLRQLSDIQRPELRQLREAIAETRIVVCVGYSGFGDVDIVSVLREAERDSAPRIIWLDRPNFKPPVGARTYEHDLSSTDANLLLKWASCTDAIRPSIGPEQAIDAVEQRAMLHFQDADPRTILRALASVAHEARYGRLGVEFYRKTAATFGPESVTDYDWGVAFERANDHKRAARYLLRAADGAHGTERVSHRAGAAFCMRQLGDLHAAAVIYDNVRIELRQIQTAETPYSDVDNVLRGRVGVYAKLAARLPALAIRRNFLGRANVLGDLVSLSQCPDPKEQRAGRLQILYEFAELEIDILSSERPRQLYDRAAELWDRSARLEDVEMQAKAARIVAATSRLRGFCLMARTLNQRRETGASRRDVPKLVFGLILAAQPFTPYRWQLVNPSDFARHPFARVRHTSD